MVGHVLGAFICELKPLNMPVLYNIQHFNLFFKKQFNANS